MNQLIGMTSDFSRALQESLVNDALVTKTLFKITLQNNNLQSESAREEWRIGT